MLKIYTQYADFTAVTQPKSRHTTKITVSHDDEYVIILQRPKMLQ